MPEWVSEAEATKARLLDVQRRIERSAQRSHREPEQVRLIAVSKTHPAIVLRRLIDAGATELGENRVQEAEAKIAELHGEDGGERGVRWHLIGHLQSNKAKRAVKLFDVVHTLDSADLAVRLDRLCEDEKRRSLDVLIQVDLGGEVAKAGAKESDLPSLIATLRRCHHLRLAGLMIIPPFYEDAEQVRPFFARLRELRDRWREKEAFADAHGELSMGMSNDFEVAVEEGATMVRVGTAIFGARARLQ